MKKQSSARARRLAIARIVSGESNAATEAQNLGVHKRTVEVWVAATRTASSAASPEPENTAPQNTVPLGKTPDGASNQALDDALEAAGEKREGGGAASIGAADVAEARIDMAKQCLDILGQLKMAVGGTLVTFRYTPPLSLADKGVQEALEIGPMANAAVRANAEKLYPVLTKLMSGPGVIWGALALDGLLMLVGLDKLAKSAGWKDAPRRAEGAPAAPVAPVPPPGMRPAVGGLPQNLREQIERARKEQVPQAMDAGLPDTTTPNVGTINAPAA